MLTYRKIVLLAILFVILPLLCLGVPTLLATDQSGTPGVAGETGVGADDQVGAALNADVPISPCIPSWSANLKASDDLSTTTQSAPSLAVDGAGNTYAVWQDMRSGSLADIYFSYRPAGGSWQPNVRINDLDGAWHGSPAIATDQAGDAYAVWYKVTGNLLQVYGSYRPAGGNWQSPVKVSDTSFQIYMSGGHASVAVDAGGGAYAVWVDGRNGSSNPDIYFSYHPAGGSWQANGKVNDNTTPTAHAFPDIAVDPAGNAYAVWEDGRYAGRNIYSSYRPAGGSWQTNARVNDSSGTPFAMSPAISVDTAGNASAVWGDGRSGGNYQIYSSYRPAGGEWQPNVKVNDTTGTETGGPQIAADATGNVYAIWIDTNGSATSTDIDYSFRPAGGNWQAHIVVNDNISPTVVSVSSIVADAAGNVYAAWQDGRNDDGDIYSSVLPSYLMRVNAGGPTYAGSSSKLWCADQAYTTGGWGYVGGSAYTVTASISNTSDQTLYKTERRWSDLAVPGYHFSVPSGQYQVTLKFAETQLNAPNLRKFNLRINGKTVLSNYDIFVAAGGMNKAAPDLIYTTYVTSGDLTIDFVNVVSKPKVNAIEVKRIFAERLNAGGAAYVDSSGQPWMADRPGLPGLWGYFDDLRPSVISTTVHLISGTSDATLYQSTRSKMYAYGFTLPNGKYKVTLKFAENQMTGAGQRVFDVWMQDVLVLSNFDIYVAAGNARYKAIDETISPVVVTDNRLVIEFSRKIGSPQINAIQIMQK